ncbi:helix-turn-helix transcriptional regulator [Alicyclobacillus fodiniaquatilis]|uniref:Helix-turn-helix transcriptional regulator n=1 Tax=Alicyclobacillus fodiniaquatilis TaxID=1661150 RepID=A0ABW4JMW7_9BACL
MAGTKNRARLLHLIDLFHMETDEEHFLSLKEIQERLVDELRESVSLRALADDIEFLRERQRVIEATVAHGEKRYSMPRSDFEVHELRLLVDAIASARSITPSQTQRLIRKIQSLTSRYMGKKLENQIYLDGRVKEPNERLKYYITDLHEAIATQSKVTFQYAKYTPTKKRKLVHDGQVYVVSPYGLIWSSDYYYLIGEHEQVGQIKSFRVDRMENVALTKEHFRRPSFNVSEYVNRNFNMYSGPVEYLEIEFDNQLVNVVIDRFGSSVRMMPAEHERFRVRVQAGVSDGLVRWLMTWGGDARVISPLSLVERMRQEAKKMMERYTE